MAEDHRVDNRCCPGAVTTFSTTSRARLWRARPSGLVEFRRGSTCTSRHCTKRREDQARARRGKWAARRLGGGRPAAPCRAGALRARRRRQVGTPAPAGSQSPPQRAPDDNDRANRAGRPPRAGILLPSKDHSKGRSLRSRRLLRNRRPLSVIFLGKTRHLSRGRRRSSRITARVCSAGSVSTMPTRASSPGRRDPTCPEARNAASMRSTSPRAPSAASIATSRRCSCQPRSAPRSS